MIEDDAITQTPLGGQTNPPSIDAPEPVELTPYFMGGQKFMLPSTMSEEDAAIKLLEFRQSPEFERTIDKKSGAPASIRAVVGAGANEEERLQTLRNYFPDATPYKEDNFIYTDPATGQYTVYNPEGFDFGDVASVAREGAQWAGSAAGAGLGSFAGPVGTYVGAGFGNYLGGQAFDALTMLSGNRVFAQTDKEAIAEAITDVAMGAVGEKIGRATAPFLQRMLGGGTEESLQILNQFAKANVTPTAGTVSPALAGAEQSLAQMPLAGNVLVKRASEVVEGVEKFSQKLTKTVGRPSTPQAAGEVAQAAAKRAMSDVAKRMDGLEKPITDVLTDAVEIPLNNVSKAKQEIERLVSQGPFYKRMYGEGLQWIDDLEKTGLRNYSSLKEIKSNLGAVAFGRLQGDMTPRVQNTLKDVYFAIGKDIVEAAAREKPELVGQIAKYNRYYSMYASNSKEFLTKLTEQAEPQRIYNTLVSKSRGGDQMLLKMKKNFKADEWDDIAATMFNDLGLAKAGRQNAAGDVFSASEFLTNWNKLSKEAKDVMFSGAKMTELRKSVDVLTDQVEELKRLEGYKNFSNSGRAMVMGLLLGSLGMGTMADSAMSQGGLAVATGIVGGGAVVSKLMSSPAFVKWLATPIDEVSGAGVTNQLAKHLARLSQIAASDKYIENEIYQYIAAVRSYTRPNNYDTMPATQEAEQ